MVPSSTTSPPSIPQVNARTWLNEMVQAKKLAFQWIDETNLGGDGWQVTLHVSLTETGQQKSFAASGKTKKLAQEIAANSSMHWARARLESSV